MTSKFVRQLVEEHPDISKVWLIGSRANNEARDDSDWDYLVFGNKALLAEIRQKHTVNQPNIDLLVVFDGDNFETPWDAPKKSGSLSGWKWKQISPTKAQYTAKKWKGNDVGLETLTRNACKVWPT